jgi:soluble lytic murein transglycosylase-like protein
MDLISQLRSSGSALIDGLRGTLSGDYFSPPKNDFGIPNDDLDAQFKSLMEKKVKAKNVYKAIDAHPEITNKDGAKDYFRSKYGPDMQYSSAIKNATSIYPEVPPALVHTILQMESSYGKNDANKKADAGEFGYLMGITKTGRYADMVKNKDTVDYQIIKRDKDALSLDTPDRAIGVGTSIIAQLIRNNLSGKQPKTAKEALKLYDSFYKTAEGAKMTAKRKKEFIDTYNKFLEHTQ